MTVTLIGFDYTDTPCIKITKGSYDPATTKDSERHKFLFSSKWPNTASIGGVDTMTHVSGSGSKQFWPAGASKVTFTKARYEAYQIYKKAHFPDLRYDLPMFSVQRRKKNGRMTIGGKKEVVDGEANAVGWKGGYIAWGAFDSGPWAKGLGVWNVDPDDGNWTVGTGTVQILREGSGSFMPWNLPGDDTPLDGPTGDGPAGSGTLAIDIGPSALRVAKPGYATSASRRYLAFSSENNPLQAIAAGDVAVPKGRSYVTLPMALPTSTLVDLIFYEKSSAITYPAAATEGWDFGAEFWIDGDRLYFENPDSAMRARYMVLSQDERAKTAGDYEVLRQFTWNGEQHVQFLRPGAKNPPSLADIALDSRWPTVQILKEGYIPVSSGGSGDHREHKVSFDSTGFFPYVKFMVHLGKSGRTYTEGVMLPYIRYQRLNRSFSGDCCYCIYGKSSVTFHTYKGRPEYVYLLDGKQREQSVDVNILGLRYYVFGIPT